ncbi:DUF3558 domain-containing protein [Streptomyces litchfieldiae]|uniref:DUF3558 domain-containing protein n=1 Tax=Streptomyces litchfieldiae TaxID=3075543 RepID=A0ABU2MPI9_9ACTN|nr:DUF3558 domain-containing protein [Streptomyces sp. DSM 44938]MDT0343425.1 DUF3558 domain-containing protein [Streptomyces sp. DSM 44938]
MTRTASRRTSRFAVRAVALAALPALLVAGCTSSGSGEDTADDEPRQSSEPTPEPVRFAELPEVCSTIGEGTIGELVPEADPAAGETLSSTDTAASGACLWSGLEEYQFRSLTVALRRFDSDLTLGTGDERADEYLRQMAEEITGDDANQDVESAELAETGESALSLAYTVVKESEEDGEQEYRQQRVVARLANVVITVDYSGAGFEGDDMPGADTVKEAAETAAREAVAAVDASAEATGEQGGTEKEEADDNLQGNDA